MTIEELTAKSDDRLNLYDAPNEDLETSKRLLIAIKKSEKSYGEISEVTGLSKSVIQRYATGETRKIPMGRLAAICRAIGSDVATVAGWINDNGDPVWKDSDQPIWNKSNISDEDRKLLESFHSAPENIQTAIWTLLTPYSEK